MACLICAKQHSTPKRRKRPRASRVCSRSCLQQAIVELSHNVEIDDTVEDDDRARQLAARTRKLTEAILAWRHYHG